MQLVIFDVDGTLVDSQDLIVTAQRQAFAACGLEAPSRARSLSIVGLSLPEAFRALVGSRGPADELVEAYKEAFRALRADPSTDEPLFPGSDETLRRLAARTDIQLGIATGKSRAGVDRILKRTGWEPLFQAIQTADDAPSKPDPGMVQNAMAATGVPPGRTVLVGDTSFDMEMARAAGARAIGVAWGYHPVAALAEAGAEAVISSFDELDALLIRPCRPMAEAGSAGAAPKRFYRQAGTRAAEGAHILTLDDRPARTPARAPLALPTLALAAAVAAEWNAQGATIRPATMPLTKLANTAIDGVAADAAAVRADIARYGRSDLVAYRAGEPDSLVAAQRAAWDPIVEWARTKLGVRLALAEGLMFVEQPPEVTAAVGAVLDGEVSPFRLAAIHVATTLTGSVLIALMQAAGEIDEAAAWRAAHVDELFQESRWGADHDATERRRAREADFGAAARFYELAGRS